MPIYEYICTACDHRADILHGINDPPPHFCPSCGRENTMRKLFAPPTIHYKGSGWAKKDRGSASRTRAASAASSGDASSGEAKSGEAKSGDAKSGDAKSGATTDGSPGSSSSGSPSTTPGD
jgi:putative FmdB family regulatory protein